MVTINSLRADRAEAMPFFEKFADENVRFSNMYATSGWMMPANGSVFTGLYPKGHGATHINKALDANSVTLAKVLKGNGYMTAGFCCNPRLSSSYGFAQGFDYYDDFTVDVILGNMAFDGEKVDINKNRTNDIINDCARGWLGKNYDKKFFMFVHYYDCHWDYLPTEKYRKQFCGDYDGEITGREIAREPLYSNPPSERDIEQIVNLYNAEVRQSDDDLKELMDYVSELGLMDNTVVLVLGDHGEQFYEHGHTSHHGVYEELVRVPMAMAVTEVNEPVDVSCIVSSVDILPSVLDYLGVEFDGKVDGYSFKDVVDGNSAKVRDYAFVEYTGGAMEDCFAVISNDGYKYYETSDGFKAVYDLKNDGLEQRPIEDANFVDAVKDWLVGK